MEAQGGQITPSAPTAKMLADPQMGMVGVGGGGRTWNGQSESPGSFSKPFMLFSTDNNCTL